jgi:glycosyltransferase involved in cell wall biosynthesis
MIADRWIMTPRDGLLEQARPLRVSSRAAPEVEIVVPVRDEERDLGPSVRRLAEYLSSRVPFSARITIADNGSTDGTWAAAVALAGELDAVRAVRLAEPGRGRALRSIWAQSDADVLAYMDVDLSTDLNARLRPGMMRWERRVLNNPQGLLITLD